MPLLLNQRLPDFIPDFVPGYQLPRGEDIQAIVNLNNQVDDGITATPAGTVQTSYRLVAAVNVVDTVATDNAGVRLPISLPGYRLIIRNGGANTMKVFALNAYIDGVWGATGVEHAAGSSRWYVCEAIDSNGIGQWSTVGGADAGSGYVTSRTALKALDTDLVTAIFLAEGGRSGEFIFRAGDYAARVALDTREGIYIAANDTPAAEGAWVRVYSGGVNILWFGAGNSNLIADDAAIAGAVAVSDGTIILPEGPTRVDAPINLTNRGFDGIKFIGQGRAYSTSGGSYILANTGGVVFDCSGTTFASFSDFTIVASGGTPSTIGFLGGRTTVFGYCEFLNIERLMINLQNLPLSNGGNGTVGIYNFGAEGMRVDHTWITADNAMVVSNSNIYNIASPYATLLSGEVSMSYVTIDCSSLSAFLRGLLIKGAAKILTPGSGTICYGSGTYGVEILGICYALHIELIVEVFPRAIRAMGLVSESKIDCTAVGTAGQPLIYLDSDAGANAPGLSNCDIAIFVQYGSSAQNLIETSVATGQLGVQGCDIHLNGSQTLSIAGGDNGGNRVLKNGATALALVNGANGTITPAPFKDWIRVSGPTGGFSIAGISTASGVVDGQLLVIYNSAAQQMTLLNEDGATTAANRIVTLTGGNLVLRAGTSAVTLRYSMADSRWIVVSSN